MGKLSRLAGIFVCSATLAATGLIASAGIGRVAGSHTVQQPQHVQGFMPTSVGFKHYMHTRQTQPIIPNQCCLLQYGGGPVLNVPHMYLIFWGFHAAGDPDNVGKLMTTWGKKLGGSAWNNIDTQYYSNASGNITNPKKEAKVWYDDTNSEPAHATDAQVQAEAAAGEAHFGYDAGGSYVVVSSYNHDPSGFITQGWCAYHGATRTSSGIISYTNLPYMPDGGSSCGGNIIGAPSDESGIDEGVTIVEGHEYSESVTDPQPFSGWNSSAGEIGDLCAWQNIQNDPFGKKSYTMQPLYSNATQSCVHSY